MTHALVVRGLVKAFGNHVAVDDISFEVPRGVVYGILGPNGAGKSTTLRMINDIFAPDQGEIVILDHLRPGAEAAQKIGYLPEERGLYPKMKVGEMIEFIGELRGLSRAEAKRRAAAWLDRLGLAQWGKNKVQDLSKGMQQKVQFATALIHEPALVILDEPWSGLDPINAEVLREVWSRPPNRATHVVDVYVNYIRRKLGTDSTTEQRELSIIETVWGAGYCLRRSGSPVSIVQSNPGPVQSNPGLAVGA